MDLLKYLIIGAGCVLLGIVVAFVARNLFAGIGIMVLTFLGYILFTLTKGLQPEKDTSSNQAVKQDN